MAYDENLAKRIRKSLGRRKSLAEIKMFGGLCFTLSGHMCCGVLKDELMVRVGPERYPDALRRPHARPMDFTGRALKGLVYVAPAGIRTDRQLAGWLNHGVEFVSSLRRKPSP